MTRQDRRSVAVAALVGCLAAAIAAPVAAMSFGTWAPAVVAESIAGTSSAFNTSDSDGCPAVTRDGLRLFMASTRAGGFGGIDLWMASRASADDSWGAPVNLGSEINTSANEFCPSPMRNGKGFLFVSNRAGGCGGDDIYVTRQRLDGTWRQPANAGCTVNTVAGEASPFLVEDDGGATWLYYSSGRAGGYSAEAPGVTSGDVDLYVSSVAADLSFGSPALVPGVNSSANDARPNVRRDNLELFFDSDRAGGSGGFDVWSAVRNGPEATWSSPVNLGPNVNSPANETRPWLTWDGLTLYFGSTRAGSEPTPAGTPSQDIYLTTRERVGG